jgi:hypothetical protein
MKKENITRRMTTVSIVDSKNKWKLKMNIEAIIQSAGTPPKGGPGPHKDLILAAVAYALDSNVGEIHVECRSVK